MQQKTTDATENIKQTSFINFSLNTSNTIILPDECNMSSYRQVSRWTWGHLSYNILHASKCNATLTAYPSQFLHQDQIIYLVSEAQDCEQPAKGVMQQQHPNCDIIVASVTTHKTLLSKWHPHQNVFNLLQVLHALHIWVAFSVLCQKENKGCKKKPTPSNHRIFF